MRRNTFALSTAAAALLAAPLLVPAPASACGGFFCDSSQPVNQAAERIIFSQGEDGSITAVIQIQYQGDADSFAWVLPVAGNPEVGVSSNAAFQRLQAQTNPQYRLTTRIEGTCSESDFSRGGPSAGGGGFADAAASAADGGVPPVSVVDGGSVGPYDYVVIAVDPEAEDLADVAVTWLQDNGYQIDDAGAERLLPYLEGGMNLLAFRLTKGNDAGSIRPVVISFGTGLASIPIRPTAVAAVEDMGVMVWVLGAHRAIPLNYMSLELNEALINWLSPGTNYGDVVTEAANQAGGQGFVTEMAGAASPLAEAIFFDFERQGWQLLSTTDWTNREGELLNQAISALGSLDGMRDALAATLPLPEGATLDQVLACVRCYYDWSQTDVDGFDPAMFVASVRTNVIEPMEETRQLFLDHAYVTRLYTTMSAEEMTRDPSFDFNADLGDVSNLHMAERVIECSPSIDQFDAPWRVELPDGQTVRGEGNTWPFSVGSGIMPANARIRRIGTTGEGEVITDNSGVISEALTDHNGTVPGPAVSVGGGTCSCRVGNGASGTGAMLALGALGMLVAARRRRSRS